MNVRSSLLIEKIVARPLDTQSGFSLPFRMGEGQELRKVVSTQLLALLAFLFVGHQVVVGANILETGFANPPMEARLHAYWWWLNGNVTKEAITRDLESMREKGFGGALIMDAGGADEDKNQPVPPGPVFGSPAWRELYRHTLREAARLKLELALNIQSGWNLGGPSVTPADAKKKSLLDRNGCGRTGSRHDQSAGGESSHRAARGSRGRGRAESERKG